MRLILAHAGISDLAWIWREAPDHPNLFFDTSWWSPADLQALLALVPPGQVLMASDAPYGSPDLGARHDHPARAPGRASIAEQVRGVAGGQALRIVNGEEPLDLGPPPGGARLPHDPLLDRVYSFLLSAIGQAFNGVEPAETLALVRLACDVGDDAPQAAVCRWVVELLDAREAYSPEGDGRPTRFAPGLHFFVGAARHRPNARRAAARVSAPHRRVGPLKGPSGAPRRTCGGRPRETAGSSFYATSRSASSSLRIASRLSARDSIWRTRSADRPSRRPVSRSGCGSSPVSPKRSVITSRSVSGRSSIVCAEELLGRG